jgi:hypothetical protein
LMALATCLRTSVERHRQILNLLLFTFRTLPNTMICFSLCWRVSRVAAGVHEVEARIGPASWNLAVRQKVEMGPFCDLRPPEEPRRRSVRH